MRRSLTHVGGPTELRGDPAEARILARCFSVRPPQRLPFTHGFHPYPARMHPEIAERAIALFAPKGRVADPFVGSGTTALEAVRAGLAFSGTDISRVALGIAWTRTRVMPPADCRKVEEVGRALRPGPPAALKGEEAAYDPATLKELASLVSAVGGVKDAVLRRILTCVVSSILVRLSRQVSDSVAAVDPLAKAPPPGTAFRLFREKCSELTKQLLALSSDLHKRKVAFVEPDLRLEDARKAAWPSVIDLVITSPPYAGTYDYALHHARRAPLFGASDAAAEIGSRSRVHDRPQGLEEYRADLGAVMKRLAPSLSPSGRMLWLIGDGVAGGRPVAADELMEEIAKSAGLRLVAVASQERADWSFNRRGPRRREHLVSIRLR